MKSFNKILCTVLAVSIICSVISFPAFSAGIEVSSYDELAAAVLSASDGDVITLTSDIIVTDTINIASDIKLNGGNALICSTSFAGVMLNVTGKLTIENVDINGGRDSGKQTVMNAITVAQSGVLDMKRGCRIHSFHSDISKSCGGIYVEGVLNMYRGARIEDVHMYKLNSTGDIIGTAVHVAKNGVFNMYGGIITDCEGKVGAVANEGLFTMSDGEICFNTSKTYGVGGGGVYNSGTFVMNGGVISDNTAYIDGGGVYNSGEFTLNLGTIRGNKAEYAANSASRGGGVATIGTFIMNNGEIVSNSAKAHGGGVAVISGSFMMCGGTVSENSSKSGKGGGVSLSAADSVMMTGGMIAGNNDGDFYSLAAGNSVPGALGGGCLVYTLYDENGNVAGTHGDVALGTGGIYTYVSNGGEHSFSDWTNIKEPLCFDTGVKERECGICGYTEKAVTPPKGHNNVVKTTPPSCTEDGLMTLYCPVCGYIHTSSVIPATGHVPGNWKIKNSAGISSDGVKEKYCVLCGETLESEKYSSSDCVVRITLSDPEDIGDDMKRVTADICINGNAGIWSAGFYLWFESALTCTDICTGSILSSADAKPSVIENVSSDKLTKEIFELSQVASEVVKAVCFYGENSSLEDTYENGVLLSLTFEYAESSGSEYKIGFAYDPDNMINVNGDNVDILFEDTLIGEKVCVLIGDVDGSGQVDAKDYKTLKNYVSGILDTSKPFYEINADVNDSGQIDAVDVKRLKLLLVS